MLPLKIFYKIKIKNMWVWPLWVPSVSGQLAYDFKTTVAPTNMWDAKIAHNKGIERVESMKPAWDIVPHSVWETYTKQWGMPSFNEQIWKILDITV